MERSGLGASTDEARDALSAGRREVDVCTDLAWRTGDPRAAALATCLALGIAHAEAERRLAEPEVASLFEEFGAGEEEDVAVFLDAAFVFVVDRELDAHQRRIRDLLGAAVRAYGKGIPSGLGASLWRLCRTGELARAYLLLASDRRRVRDDGDPAAYWAALVAAGNLLPDGDGIGEAREHCHRMAELHPGER
ncbi:hypothetical protein SUDANB105_05097 [Streptomyces sp. enrichment culture]|uniref:hypothetical protein n=1 Tax=Streptomyces sp. enrichment culture TaxID=1795815 RepID=UPI003F57DAF1